MKLKKCVKLRFGLTQPTENG